MISCIHYIRHGQTEGTEKGFFYGKTNLPLSKNGIEDTKRLAAEGVYPRPENPDYISSGMIRANTTLEIIYGDVPYKTIPSLEEMNFGDFELRTFDEIKDDFHFVSWRRSDADNMKALAAKWFEEDGETRPPNGESKGEFAKRISAGLKELEGYHQLKELSNRHSGKESHTIMVCHGGVIAMCMLLSFPGVKTFWDWVPKPGHGYTVYYEDGKPARWEEF